MSDTPKKRPNEPQTPFRGEFSFVNKDASNIQSKDHNAAVSWHVMHRYEKFKKKERTKRLKASARLPAGSLQPPRASGSSTDQHASFTSQPDAPSPGQSLNEFFPRGGEPSVAQASIVSFSASPLSSPLAQPFVPVDEGRPVLGLDSLTGEAFESTALSFSPLISDLVFLAYNHFVPQAWPMDIGVPRWSYELARSWEDVTAISRDSCYANAYLATLGSMVAADTDDECLAAQARAFQSQAVQEIGQRTASTKGRHDLLTLKAVLKLFSAETLVDNTGAARAHLKLLQKLVAASGGAILLDSWFQENLLSCDCYFALKYETRPLFPASEWTPGPLQQPWRARLVTAGITDDHTAEVDVAVEHLIIRTAIGDLRELFQIEDYIATHEISPDDHLLRWRQLRRFDCVNRISEHLLNLTIFPHLFFHPHTQALTCASVALMAAMVLGCPEPVRFGTKLVKDLRVRMQKATTERSQEDPTEKDGQRLMLWVTYCGLLAESVLPLPDEERCFMEEHNSVATRLRLAGTSNTKEVLRSFLISRRLQQEIESGRPYRLTESRRGLYENCGTSWREPATSSFPSTPITTEPVPATSGKGKERTS